MFPLASMVRMPPAQVTSLATVHPYRVGPVRSSSQKTVLSSSKELYEWLIRAGRKYGTMLPETCSG
jgi:hypothetical protein